MDIKVGDKIYFDRFGRLDHVQEVIRITPTGMIKTKSHNLKGNREYLKVTGQDKWSVIGAKVETPELIKQWHELNAAQWLRKNYTRLTVEDIEPLMQKYGDEE